MEAPARLCKGRLFVAVRDVTQAPSPEQPTTHELLRASHCPHHHRQPAIRECLIPRLSFECRRVDILHILIVLKCIAFVGTFEPSTNQSTAVNHPYPTHPDMYKAKEREDSALPGPGAYYNQQQMSTDLYQIFVGLVLTPSSRKLSPRPPHESPSPSYWISASTCTFQNLVKQSRLSLFRFIRHTTSPTCLY